MCCKLCDNTIFFAMFLTLKLFCHSYFWFYKFASENIRRISITNYPKTNSFLPEGGQIITFSFSWGQCFRTDSQNPVVPRNDYKSYRISLTKVCTRMWNLCFLLVFFFNIFHKCSKIPILRKHQILHGKDGGQSISCVLLGFFPFLIHQLV